MVHLEDVKGTLSRNSSLDLNFNRSRRLNDVQINGPIPNKRKPNNLSTDVRILNTRMDKYSAFNFDKFSSNSSIYPTLNVRSSDFRSSNNSWLYSTTPSIHSLNSPTVKIHSFNPEKLSISVLNFSTLKYRTINFPLLKVHTQFSQKRSSSMPNSLILRSRTLNPQKLNKHTVNTAKSNVQTFKDQILDDQKLNEWLEDTNVKPNKDFQDSRHSHIDGLMHFKKKVNQINEIKKKGYNFNDDDIIPNDKYELDNIIAYSEAIPNFKESYVDKAAERFDRIQLEYLEHKVKEQEESGRRDNDYRRQLRRPSSMERILALMNQFISQSHIKLVNGQLLKWKYVENIKYKIGYVFSCLRILKQQQMRLYSSMHYYRFVPPKAKDSYYAPVADAMYYLMLYEKIMRLDEDIVSMVNYLWELETQREKAAVIDATRFPKRKKYTPAVVATYYVTPPKHGW